MKHCYSCKHYQLTLPTKKAKQIEFCNLLGRSVLVSIASNNKVTLVPTHTGLRMLKDTNAIPYDSEARTCEHYVK